MSLEGKNKELHMFFEPQKQRNKAENAQKRKNDILSQILFLNPLYVQQLYLAHFSFILNDFKSYKCAITKSIKFNESEKLKRK
jgi:hypothetical protein